MFEFIGKLFNKESTSKNVAKERLRLVLIHDRASISPHLLHTLKGELISLISKYMEIDEDALEITLDSENDSVALVANIPVRSMKRTANGAT
ncbi:cell division topological specificity factor MinE [Desulfofarcimen acetoxidans DSM 771]|uniref:Cell division topological specificity factor n=1 Tax=Desulfofarcimen acetoxidans (strain ATCC 49208 / DSM 771 / KCTC 5769 / VKM B-1644 / 5575) TaxID=485916 RepID=C8W5R4_DESAS|nr:cell division topological specificity factor MinE [Desulfofarcimen acetoxidans]ACV64064.1 cell division topological specificity factor MinE [Desulfofarcimen acetoxidans DSM 771]